MLNVRLTKGGSREPFRCGGIRDYYRYICLSICLFKITLRQGRDRVMSLPGTPTRKEHPCCDLVVSTTRRGVIRQLHPRQLEVILVPRSIIKGGR